MQYDGQKNSLKKSEKKRALSMWISPLTKFSDFELDEVYWFIRQRKKQEMGVNTYIMTMLCRYPRQIVSFAVDNSRSEKTIQGIVDSVKIADKYHTDGGTCYLGVDFGEDRHNRNTRDKSDTHNIESSNADLRHYIAGLKRRSRCFFRDEQSLIAVLWLFCNALNKFGDAKLKYRLQKKIPPNKRITDYPFSISDFIQYTH